MASDGVEVPDQQDAVDAALAVLERLRLLAVELTPTERSVLGALLAPSFTELLESEAEVSGFGLVEWDVSVLPRAIAESVRARRLDLEIG